MSVAGYHGRGRLTRFSNPFRHEEMTFGHTRAHPCIAIGAEEDDKSVSIMRSIM